MAKQPQKRQRFLIISISLAFAGSTVGLALIGLWGNSGRPSPVAPVSTAQVLAAKEQGYQAVLRREPENPTALLGLADTRLKMEDLEGALVPLERLATLYPEDARVSVMVEALKQRIAEKEAGEAATQKQPAEP